MSVRPLRYFGDPVLTATAEPITRFDAAAEELVRDLMDTVAEPSRAGLAAPQIGVPLRAFSYRTGKAAGYVLNPVLVEVSERTRRMTESCLSMPELWFPVARAHRAVVQGVDLRNEPVVVEGEGSLAQCLLHELDHLDGVLLVQRTLLRNTDPRGRGVEA